MPSNRFYLNSSLIQGNEVILEGDQCDHLNYIMRKKEGDSVELFNGIGSLAKAKILKIEKTKATLALLEVTFKRPIVTPLTLIQALPRPSHLKFIIQKGTELGVSSFHLFPSSRSETLALSPHHIKRLKQISIEAAKQCGRLDLPKIYAVSNMEYLQLPEGNAYFGDLNGVRPLPYNRPPYLLFIGPEKGFTQKEQLAIKSNFQAQGVKLHPYTLRVETAAIVAVTLALQGV